MDTNEDRNIRIWKEVLGTVIPAEPQEGEIDLDTFSGLVKRNKDYARKLLNKLEKEGKITSRMILGRKYYKPI